MPTTPRSNDAPPRSSATPRTSGTSPIAGTPAEVVDRIGSYRDLGAETVYLQVLDLHDLDHIRLIAAEVLPAFS